MSLISGWGSYIICEKKCLLHLFQVEVAGYLHRTGMIPRNMLEIAGYHWWLDILALKIITNTHLHNSKTWSFSFICVTFKFCLKVANFVA